MSSARRLTRAVFDFERSRFLRSASFILLAIATLLVAALLSFTLGPNVFPAPMSLEAWLGDVVPVCWFAVGFPLCATNVAGAIAGSDIASGSIRLAISIPFARRALALGKLQAIAVVLLLLNMVFSTVVLLAMWYHATTGEVAEGSHAMLRLARTMTLGFFGGAVWAAAVCWLAVRLGSAARAAMVGGFVLMVTWMARGQFGAAIEPWLVPMWGVVLADKPTLLGAPVALSLMLLSWAIDREMRLLEPR
ncbi:MAG: hypothetical protein HEQ38_06045 [Gemmatimonas sp.]|nr:hypothetical protein [Gemmatimonas sp.]